MNFADLGRALDLMRSGQGQHRQELRQLLQAVDPQLRRLRNVERLRLAQLKFQIQTETRGDLAAQRTALERSAQRLADLDLEITKAIARRMGGKNRPV